MARICDLEATYSFALQKYQENPSLEKQRELVKKQIMIDEKRSWEYQPLRWFTRAELSEMDHFEDSKPTVSRQPVALSDNWEWAEKPKRVMTSSGTTTMTLDFLIERLQELREEHGGDAPVFHVEYGGLTDIFRVSADKKCIVIE